MLGVEQREVRLKIVRGPLDSVPILRRAITVTLGPSVGKGRCLLIDDVVAPRGKHERGLVFAVIEIDTPLCHIYSLGPFHAAVRCSRMRR